MAREHDDKSATGCRLWYSFTLFQLNSLLLENFQGQGLALELREFQREFGACTACQSMSAFMYVYRVAVCQSIRVEMCGYTGCLYKLCVCRTVWSLWKVCFYTPRPDPVLWRAGARAELAASLALPSAAPWRLVCA